MSLQEAVDYALTLAVNQGTSAIARARQGLLDAGLSLDQKRTQAWCEFGWPADVTNALLYRLFKRGGVAHGAVGKIIDTCWLTPPEIIQGTKDDESADTTQWEKQVGQVLTARIWRQWKEADRRRMVNRYSGMILHVADNETWEKPVTRQSSALTKITPVWAGALQPKDIVRDTSSPDYGMPRKWLYKETQGQREVEVHPDRIFVLGDWHEGAIAFLEPAFNTFITLEKVEGGSGESFLKNASRQISVNFDKDIDLKSIAATYGVPLPELQEKFNEAAREINRGNDQMLITQGAQVAPLTSPVADPEATYSVNIKTISAALDIPEKILIGNQTGERASTEDLKYFHSRCQSRRGDLSFEIEDFIHHLARIKIIDPQPFAVVWDNLNEQTSSQKLESADKMSAINARAFDPASEPFTAAEIRTAAGYSPKAE